MTDTLQFSALLHFRVVHNTVASLTSGCNACIII